MNTVQELVNMVKKIIDTTKKQGSEFAKIAGKRSNKRFDWK